VQLHLNKNFIAVVISYLKLRSVRINYLAHTKLALKILKVYSS